MSLGPVSLGLRWSLETEQQACPPHEMLTAKPGLGLTGIYIALSPLILNCLI